MRALQHLLLAAALTWANPTLANEVRRPWQHLGFHVTDALHAFRQTDHWIAEAMMADMDGQRQGRNHEVGLPYNFDPSRHLAFATIDLNGDGTAEVFLLFEWSAVRGNQQAHGVVMQLLGRNWRIACDFADWGDRSRRGGIRILLQRHHGWRDFRSTDGIYAWRPVRGVPGAMECEPVPTPSGRPRRGTTSAPAPSPSAGFPAAASTLP